MDYSQFGTVDPAILKQLQDAYARNPSLRTQLGESGAGAYYGIDPASRQGDFYMALDEQGRPNIYRDLERNTFGQDSAAVYGMDGAPIGMSSGDSTALGLLKAAALSAAGYGAASALGGAGAGGAAGNGAWLGEGAASGVPAWDAAAAGAGAAPAAGGAAATGAASSGAGNGAWLGEGVSSGVPAWDTAAKTAAGTGSNLGSLGNLNAGGLLGAVAGAMDSKDQQQTTSRDPWAPAQPFLKDLLATAQGLLGQYSQTPISAQQQQYAQRVNGLLDQQNQALPGLLSQAQALGTFRKGR